MNKKIRLGDLLIQNKMITEEQLQEALVKQKDTGGKLGQVLVDFAFIEEDRLLNLLAEHLKVPYIDLKYYEFDKSLIYKLSGPYARRHHALILKETPKDYLVGMSDPQDLYAIDQISSQLDKPIKLALVKEKDLEHSIDLLYRRSEDISGFAEELSEEVAKTEIDLTAMGKNFGAQDAPVVKLLQSLFEDAVQINASDIHIEPDENVIRIRQRVDGVLHEQVMQEKHIAPALAQRLKLMAGLNIAERRLPQDGRFNIRIRAHNIDVRISFMPSQYGESVVMRLLDQAATVLDLEGLGIPSNMCKRIRALYSHPFGMLLVTGPTGSGKTTTLYSVLSELNNPDKKIVTVEDPVEYRLPRITQVQVNPKIGLDFSGVLRSTLRQDPDIIMVGEIRDRETAAIALRAAMTGHLVLATLHTNDAIGSAMRLVDIGVEGYLVASAIKAVIAQRLVRRICESCAKLYEPDPQEKIWLAEFNNKDAKLKFYKGSGCTHCHNSGFHGRIGVYELLEFDAPMLDALRQNDSSSFIKAAKKSKSFRPLALTALDLAIKGITTLSEVLRIAGELEEEDEKLGIDKIPEK